MKEDPLERRWIDGKPKCEKTVTQGQDTGLAEEIKQESPGNGMKRHGMKVKNTNKNKRMVTIMIHIMDFPQQMTLTEGLSLKHTVSYRSLAFHIVWNYIYVLLFK